MTQARAPLAAPRLAPSFHAALNAWQNSTLTTRLPTGGPGNLVRAPLYAPRLEPRRSISLLTWTSGPQGASNLLPPQYVDIPWITTTPWPAVRSMEGISARTIYAGGQVAAATTVRAPVFGPRIEPGRLRDYTWTQNLLESTLYTPKQANSWTDLPPRVVASPLPYLLATMQNQRGPGLLVPQTPPPGAASTTMPAQRAYGREIAVPTWTFAGLGTYGSRPPAPRMFDLPPAGPRRGDFLTWINPSQVTRIVYPPPGVQSFALPAQVRDSRPLGMVGALPAQFQPQTGLPVGTALVDFARPPQPRYLWSIYQINVAQQIPTFEFSNLTWHVYRVRVWHSYRK